MASFRAFSALFCARLKTDEENSAKTLKNCYDLKLFIIQVVVLTVCWKWTPELHKTSTSPVTRRNLIPKRREVVLSWDFYFSKIWHDRQVGVADLCSKSHFEGVSKISSKLHVTPLFYIIIIILRAQLLDQYNAKLMISTAVCVYWMYVYYTNFFINHTIFLKAAPDRHGNLLNILTKNSYQLIVKIYFQRHEKYIFLINLICIQI